MVRVIKAKNAKFDIDPHILFQKYKELNQGHKNYIRFICGTATKFFYFPVIVKNGIDRTIEFIGVNLADFILSRLNIDIENIKSQEELDTLLQNVDAKSQQFGECIAEIMCYFDFLKSKEFYTKMAHEFMEGKNEVQHGT